MFISCIAEHGCWQEHIELNFSKSLASTQRGAIFGHHSIWSRVWYVSFKSYQNLQIILCWFDWLYLETCHFYSRKIYVHTIVVTKQLIDMTLLWNMKSYIFVDRHYHMSFYITSTRQYTLQCHIPIYKNHRLRFKLHHTSESLLSKFKGNILFFISNHWGRVTHICVGELGHHWVW